MAHRVASDLAHTHDARLGPDATDDLQDEVIAGVIESALQAGQESVARGPDLLPVLRDAGVVDAGGYGLTVLLAGIVGALRGGEGPTLEHHAAARVSHPQHGSVDLPLLHQLRRHRVGLEQRRFITELEKIGDSVLVVGDSDHAQGPRSRRRPRRGHRAVRRRRRRLAPRRGRHAPSGQGPPGRLGNSGPSETVTAVCGALAVVNGAGMSTLFQSLGLQVLDGGPTLNPSTYDLLAAIHALPAEQVIVLPNSANVQMAAERAAELSDKTVQVVPSRSQQAGLAAAVSLDADRDAAANAEAMRATLEHVRTGAVAPAARDDAQGRFRAGDAIGFVEEELVAWGEPEATLRDVIGQLAVNAELITCLRGADAPLDDQTVHALVSGDIELELSEGGQPSYWWLLSAE